MPPTNLKPFVESTSNLKSLICTTRRLKRTARPMPKQPVLFIHDYCIYVPTTNIHKRQSTYARWWFHVKYKMFYSSTNFLVSWNKRNTETVWISITNYEGFSLLAHSILMWPRSPLQLPTQNWNCKLYFFLFSEKNNGTKTWLEKDERNTWAFLFSQCN